MTSRNLARSDRGTGSLTMPGAKESLEAVLSEDPIEPWARYSQCACSPRLMAVKHAEHALHVRSLESVECWKNTFALRIRGTQVDVLCANDVPASENYGACQAILELSNIARPGVCDEQIHRLA